MASMLAFIRYVGWCIGALRLSILDVFLLTFSSYWHFVFAWRLYWWVRWGKVHCRSSWRVEEQWRCYQLGQGVFVIIGDPWLTRNPESMQIGAQFNGIGFRFILRDWAISSWSMLCPGKHFSLDHLPEVHGDNIIEIYLYSAINS